MEPPVVASIQVEESCEAAAAAALQIVNDPLLLHMRVLLSKFSDPSLSDHHKWFYLACIQVCLNKRPTKPHVWSIRLSNSLEIEAGLAKYMNVFKSRSFDYMSCIMQYPPVSAGAFQHAQDCLNETIQQLEHISALTVFQNPKELATIFASSKTKRLEMYLKALLSGVSKRFTL